ncbi:MAG: FtsX-like permease family protein [Puia sp.]
MGLDPAKAAGTRITDANARTWEIVGVMKDFNYGSLHNDIESFMVWITHKADGYWANLTVHTTTNNNKELLGKIESVWRRIFPEYPLNIPLWIEQVQKQYESDISMSRIINAFTFIAICISCLGLFGLAAFSAERRNKEIGIRKVLGASVSGIVQLLSKDFLVLIIIAFIIATPISWWAMNKWLQGFAYRTPVNWWMFGIAGIVTMIIALLTVSSQAIRAAIMNPVKSLRSE